MNEKECLEKHNRAQDERLTRRLVDDHIDNHVEGGFLDYGGINFLSHKIPNYSFSNDEQTTKIKDSEINRLNAVAKNLVTSIEIFQQGSERQQFSISLSPTESTKAVIEQRVTTVEEEQRLLYVARDSIELKQAGLPSYMRAERSESNDSENRGFSITGSLLVNGQYRVGNLNAMTAQMLNLFVVLFGEIVRKSSVWDFAGKLGVGGIEVTMFNTANIMIKMIYGAMVDTAIVDTKTKIVTMHRSDKTKYYFDLDDNDTDMQKAIRVLTVLAVSSLEDTEFFVNTIGTKQMIQRRPLTYGFNSPVIYDPITLDDLLKNSKRRFVAVDRTNTCAGEDGFGDITDKGLPFS